MVTMTWGRSPPAAGRVPVARATLAGADEAVEAFLRPCAQVERDVPAVIPSVLRPSFPASAQGLASAAVPAASPAAAVPGVSAAAARPGAVVRGLVAVFMTVRRCSNCSAVAKISRCWSPWRGLRMKAPWSWRRSSSEGSAPSWSSASVQLRATRARKSGSFSTAVRVRACSIPAGGLGVADVPDTVQGQGDDGRGPGRDLTGGDGGAEFPVDRREGFAGEALPRQQAPRRG